CAQTEQEVFECADVAPHRTAIASEERECLEVAHHLGRIIAIERGDAQANVPDELDDHPTGTARDDRSEDWVVHEARDHLDAALDQRLDEKSDGAVSRAIEPLRHLLRCLAKAASIAKVERDATNISFVN